MLNTLIIGLDKKITSIQCLSNNQLKMIATICMLIDHVTKVFYRRMSNPLLAMDWMTPLLSQWMHGTYILLISIGAVAFPIFAFTFVEGCTHTHDKKHYLLRLVIFALISEIPFDITFNFAGGPAGWESKISQYWPMWWGYQNIYFTYVCAFSAIWCFDKAKNIKRMPLTFLLRVSIALFAYVFNKEVIQGDYGGYGMVLILTIYALRKNRLAQIAGMVAIYVLLYQNFSNTSTWFGVSFAMSLILILLYNGKRGEKNLKHFFYCFYPAHITVIGLLDWLISNIYEVSK